MAFRGNSKQRREYIDFMQSQGLALSNFQYDLSIGLILSPRKLTSRFGNMTQARFDNVVGTALTGSYITSYRRPSF